MGGTLTALAVQILSYPDIITTIELFIIFLLWSWFYQPQLAKLLRFGK